MRPLISLLMASACVLGVIAGIAALSERAPSASQVFATPKGQADNVQFTQLAGAVVQITYDLVSDDPRAVFSVTLEASDDRGQTWSLKPKSITGDIGQTVQPGPGKKIIWDAGKDVETIRIDQFRFNVIAVAGRALPPPSTAGRTGRLAVRTTPDGATLVIDGQTRGLTPVTVGDLSVGEHQIIVSKAGYLDNRSTVQVRSDAMETVAVQLTANTPAPTPTAKSGQGGMLKWILIGGGGAAAAGLLAGNKGTAPPPVTAPPNTNTPAGPGSSTTTTTTIGPSRVTLSGIVTDDGNGAPIARAQPTILDGPNAGTVNVFSAANGSYTIPDLTPGTFTIEFRAPDYDKTTPATVTVTGNLSRDFRMHLATPQPDFFWSPDPCLAIGTATDPGIQCTVDASTSSGKIDSYNWSYPRGSGFDVRHPIQLPCGTGINSLQVTLTATNRSGSRSVTRSVPIEKRSGCY